MAGKTSTVLLAVDDSSNAEYCMNFYLQRLHKQGNKLVILHVPEYWGDMARMMSPARLTEVYNDSQKKAKEIGEKFHTIAAKNSVSDIEFVKQDGNDPWHVIVDVAKEKKADFIVMGSRGMGKLRRTLVGSVSDGVVHHAHIPVMVIFGNADKPLSINLEMLTIVPFMNVFDGNLIRNSD